MSTSTTNQALTEQPCEDDTGASLDLNLRPLGGGYQPIIVTPPDGGTLIAAKTAKKFRFAIEAKSLATLPDELDFEVDIYRCTIDPGTRTINFFPLERIANRKERKQKKTHRKASTPAYMEQYEFTAEDSTSPTEIAIVVRIYLPGSAGPDQWEDAICFTTLAK